MSAVLASAVMLASSLSPHLPTLLPSQFADPRLGSPWTVLEDWLTMLIQVFQDKTIVPRFQVSIFVLGASVL